MAQAADVRVARRVDPGALFLAFALSSVFTFAGWLRFEAVHNRTFDLAFYARMAWGLVHLDGWMPLTESHVLGLHVSPVLLPVGLLGTLIGHVPALLIAQGLSAFGAAWVLATMGRRHLGKGGDYAGVLVFLCHPNLVHVLSYEAHPGTLSLFPLALLIERLDRRDGQGMLFATLGVLACREDFALLTAIAGLLFLWPSTRLRRSRKRYGAIIVLLSALWLGVFVLYLHPAHAPAGGSFDLHLGRWGRSPAEVLRSWIREPHALLAHLSAPAKASYLLRVAAPMLFFCFFAPRLALVAAPVLAMNLVSTFHTTANLDSHYLTPALVPLAGAALAAAPRMVSPRRAGFALGAAAVFAFAMLGPWAELGSIVRSDGTSEAARRAIAEVGAHASVQAPEPLLPHLAERSRIHRPAPFDTGDDFVIFDGRHRQRYARQGVLLRTIEEPVLRDWLNHHAFGLRAAYPPFYVFERGAPPRASIEARLSDRGVSQGARLCACLRWVGAIPREPGVELILEADDACPTDLALRLYDRRVELIGEGEIGMAHLRAGDRFRSFHEDVSLERLRLRAIRSSGAPPEPNDPVLRYADIE